MDRLGIYKLFSDKNKTIGDLYKDIKIGDFVSGIHSHNVVDKGKRITYGANVRLFGETDSDIIPFNYSNVESFKPTEVAKKVENGFRIPDFLKLFGLDEIIFRVNYTQTENTIKVLEIETRPNFIVPSSYREKDIDNGYIINKNDDRDTINKKLLNGFFLTSSLFCAII